MARDHRRLIKIYMPLKKLKAGAKKVAKTAKAVDGGYKDYAGQVNQIQKQAEKEMKKTNSRNLNVSAKAKLVRKKKKEQGVSVKSAIKKRLGY